MILVGQVIRGYCGGDFGRDWPHEGRVEAIGHDWILARTEDGGVWVARGENIHETMTAYQEEYNKNPYLEDDLNGR